MVLKRQDRLRARSHPAPLVKPGSGALYRAGAAMSVELYTRLNDDFASFRDADSVSGMLGWISDRYGLESVAYFGVNAKKPSVSDPYLAVTYSSEWISHYVEQQYVEIDPVLQRGFGSILPIDWQTFDIQGIKLKRFFGEAREFGLGTNGLTVPVRGRKGSRALFTITSGAGHREWQALSGHLKRELLLLSYQVHQTVEIQEGLVEDTPRLSPRELECLKWSASGKTVAEIGIILGLSDKTVRYYLDQARFKLDATNNTHAVAKALNTNLITL